MLKQDSLESVETELPHFTFKLLTVPQGNHINMSKKMPSSTQ